MLDSSSQNIEPVAKVEKVESQVVAYKFPKGWRERHRAISSPTIAKLADAIRKSELTVHQIANKSGICVATIRAIARGTHGGSPWYSTVSALSKTLNINIK